MPLRVSKKQLQKMLGQSATARIVSETKVLPEVAAQLPPDQVDGADTLKALIHLFGDPFPPYESEYFPFEDSDHRIDLAWPQPEYRLAVEVDGGRWAAGGGRHMGDDDYRKINKLVLNGWRVLRFPTTILRNDPSYVM